MDPQRRLEELREELETQQRIQQEEILLESVAKLTRSDERHLYLVAATILLLWNGLSTLNPSVPDSLSSPMIVPSQIELTR